MTDEQIDTILYSYGLEMYEDIPLIEPPETIDIPIAKFYMAIDASGSCDEEMVSKFFAQTASVVEEMTMGENAEINLRLFVCDTEIYQEFEITSKDDFPDVSEISVRGGGTDFVPVFERISELEKESSSERTVLFYYSDGMGRFPDIRPDYDTYFLIDERFEQDIKRVGVPEWVNFLYI